ncbi:MAG TPA: site-2 protease family protein [Opitutaceae bacterium]|nr:site-2 protease family protein [Opitutaceae bacterium]
MDGIDLNQVRSGLIFFIILVSSLCVHEWAHAFTAEKLGDPTPRMDGRVTLNPMAHSDLLGTVIFPLMCIFLIPGGFLFGWAKPVMTNPSYFKHHARDSMLVAAAGPASNFAIALIGAVVGRFLFNLEPRTVEIFAPIVTLNVVLAVFNLLPIPPLDGSHLMRHLTGMRDETYLMMARWGGLILLAIILIEPLRRVLWFVISIALIPFMVIFPELRYGFGR